MKLGAIALVTALLFAPPALAGTHGDILIDTDSDGVNDPYDNCSAIANPTQTDSDSDGHGNLCDCDYDQSNICDGPDFVLLGQNWGSAVPPAPPRVDQDDSGIIDGPDFVRLGVGWGTPPGPSCTNPPGTPCP